MPLEGELITPTSSDPPRDGLGASGGEAVEPPDSLYSHESGGVERPWWQRTLFHQDRTLFGAWDGVFTTVMLNIFGVIVFLRMGWIVGTAGVANAILLLIICASLALISVFSAIGIVERCQIQNGGIYFLISHVLGSRMGGAVGLIYALGQAVATGLVAVGFGESVAHLLSTDSRAVVKAVAIVTIIVLTAVNTAGISWVVRLQILLLFCLGLAVFDFILGALFTSNPDEHVFRGSLERLRKNGDSYYSGVNCTDKFNAQTTTQIPPSSFFTVFGVFFANFLGVLAGVNMSGDLKNPHEDIPLGEISAVGVSSTVCFFFIMVLGATCDRVALLCDNMISEKVALTGLLFLGGLYICSLSSTIGSLLGTPRVLQGIAADGIVPILRPLAQGVGPNDNPLLAAYVLMGVASVFVLLGDLNQLAILSTMPFLITYAFVNYSYVSLAMSYDLAHVSEVTTSNLPTYGSTPKGDLDELFPERRTTTVTVETGAQDITSQPMTWWSMFSNSYIAFVGFLVNLLILLLIHFWFAIIHFAALIALYYYIGRVCPSCSPGVSTFSIPHMFRTAFSNIESIGAISGTQCVLPTTNPASDVTTSQQNLENQDYQQRKQYHHAEHITSQLD